MIVLTPSDADRLLWTYFPDEPSGHPPPLSVAKPWGDERQIYANREACVWELRLAPGQETSLHCHRRTSAILYCLSGFVQVKTLRRTVSLRPGEWCSVHPGVFHGVENTLTCGDSLVIEVESPPGKADLVRLADRHGRVGRDAAEERRALDRPFPDITVSTWQSADELTRYVLLQPEGSVTVGLSRALSVYSGDGLDGWIPGAEYLTIHRVRDGI